MNYKFKDISIKNHTFYFFNDIINIKNFEPNNIKIDEKPCKNIFIYYIGCVTIKVSKYLKTKTVNPSYFIFSKVCAYFQEINGNKYLTLVPASETKEKKYTRNCGVKSDI